MNRFVLLSLLLFVSHSLAAQDPFIKLTDASYGASSRILPSSGGGWVIFSADSLKLSKYNSCGAFEWGKKYTTDPLLFGMYDFIRLRNGDFAFMHLIAKGSVKITNVTRLDPNGNIIWSNSYGDADYNHYMYSLLEDDNGDLIAFGNIEHVTLTPFFNALMKMDAGGNLLWTKIYNHGGIWGGAIATSDGGFLLRTGDFLIKTDPNGSLQWSSYLNTSSYYYLAPIEVSDGFICSAFAQPSNEMLFLKTDKQGNQQWGAGKTLNITGNPPRLINTPTGTIAGIFRYGNLSRIMELDKDLNILAENTLDSTMNIHGSHMSFQLDGTPVLTGFTNAGLVFFAKLNAFLHSGCDQTVAPLTINSYPGTIVPTPTNVSGYTFSATAETFPVSAFSVVVNSLCLPPKFLDLGPDTSICEGSSLQLKNKFNNIFAYYHWSTGDTTSVLQIHESGQYILTAGDNCGENILTDTIHIVIRKTIPADPGPDGILCDGETVEIGKNVCDSCSYLWSTGDTIPFISVDEEGLYILTFLFDNGCSTTDSIEIRESKCECDLHLPGAFTPNADNKNDTFYPLYYCDLADYSLHIFNRWGQEVFTSNDPEKAWDGAYRKQEAKSDVYAYLLKYTPIIRGEKSKNVMKSGTVVLLR